MSTERTVAEVARFAEQVARSLNQSAAEFRATREAGDPQGIGIDRLAGRIEAYEDAAMFIRGQAGRLRGDERPSEARLDAAKARRPVRLEVVS